MKYIVRSFFVPMCNSSSFKVTFSIFGVSLTEYCAALAFPNLSFRVAFLRDY